MGWYIFTGVVCFLLGVFVTAKISGKDNINIGIGNKSVTQVYRNGELVEED